MSEHHPYCELFPLLAADELQQLADDIKVNGLRSPIMRDAEGLILDGRNREAACLLGKVTPRYDVFVGTDEEKLKYVVSENLRRRHLTTSQRASIAARLKEMYAEQAKARQRANGKSRAKSKKKNPANLPDSKSGDARDKAGKAMKVSGKAVDMAVKVREHAIPEIVAAVDAGNLAVSAAANVASLSRSRQQSIVESGGVPAVRAAAAAVRRSRGKIVAHDAETPETPSHVPCMPVKSAAVATPDESLDALLESAIASSHFRRIEVIESLLATLPEDKVRMVQEHCKKLLAERRSKSQTENK